LFVIHKILDICFSLLTTSSLLYAVCNRLRYCSAVHWSLGHCWSPHKSIQRPASDGTQLSSCVLCVL